MGSQYFRFFDIWKAEGITLSGQTVLDKSYNAINGLISGLLKQPDSDRVTASDTDSCYIDLSDVVKKFVKPGEDTVEFLDKFCSKVVKKTLDTAFDELAHDTNAFVNRINMKREAIGNAVFVAKKNYVMRVYDNEGVRYAEPEMKMTGVEAIKSSTPKFFRERLAKAYEFAFQPDQKLFHDYVEQVYKDYMQLPLIEVSAATSVSEVDKYSDGNGKWISGTPSQSKAALVYNAFIRKHKLEELYPIIQPGDKIRMLKLKEPNPWGVPAIAFSNGIPPEMNLNKWVDKESQYEKFFINPVMRVFSILNWYHEEKVSVDDLFG